VCHCQTICNVFRTAQKLSWNEVFGLIVNSAAGPGHPAAIWCAAIEIGQGSVAGRRIMAVQGDVVVLGAGVIGVTAAYYLAASGLRVTVVDRQNGAGLETSFANGGLVTPSMADPWASPGIPRLLLKWFGRENSPFLIRPSALPALMTWGWRFLRNCNAATSRHNTEIILRLARYSHHCLQHLVQEVDIDYDTNRRGTLHLFRDRLSMDSSRRTAEIIGALGVSYQILDTDGCVELEPALASQADHISGGIHYPEDEAGDAFKFTEQLAKLCAANGVEFRFGQTVRRIEVEGGAVSAVVTDRDRIATTTCIVALGSDSTALLRPLGVKLPIYPVKGYSVTFPATGWNGAPSVPFVDDGRKMGIVRLGDRVRVAGTAEFAGFDRAINPKRIANLRGFFSELFPDYPNGSHGQEWTGLRPMTPDGIPYLGRTSIPGLFLNTGQGHLGWTMSCGSAKAVSDVIVGRQPEIDLSGMGLHGR
jgi:D-amino-acid dehydrogenase